MVLSSFRDPEQGKWLDNQSGRAEATSGWVTIDKRECVIGKQIQTSLLYIERFHTDAKAAIMVFQKMKRRPCWSYNTIQWQLNYGFDM